MTGEALAVLQGCYINQCTEFFTANALQKRLNCTGSMQEKSREQQSAGSVTGRFEI
ncbi:MAG: hypothetical protein ACI9WS_002542 [Paraglaciecola psychrophila]|jgi:hypothetical protein